MKRKFKSYLSKLQFYPELYNSFHAKYIVNIRLVLLLVLTILALGITSLFILPRRLDPEIKLVIVTVSTVLPGAGPSDVESLVTIPIENKLMGINGLDTINSVSQENVSVISMQFKSGVDKDKARNDVQSLVSEVTGLPSDAKAPQINALDFENQPIWVFALSKAGDISSLSRFATYLKDEIKNLSFIDRVSLGGDETQQIMIVAEAEKIRNYGLSPNSISSLIKNTTQAYPAGPVETEDSSFSLALDSQVSSLEDIRNLRINAPGQTLRLGDIAKVYEKSQKGILKSYIVGKNADLTQAIIFSVYKTSSSDIDKSVKAVESKVDEILKKAEGQYSITTISNSGEQLGKQFTDLIGEFQSTLLLVFINLFLFLGIRQALIACITIPLTFLMAFAWMGILGQTINFISLFALLLAFGTSIDDTIVTVSAMTSYFRTGKFTPHQTGILVWRDFIVPIWTTTVTTVWAFLPLILSTGIIGEFIKPIPIVVATTMYTSTAITWFITLPLMIVFLKLSIAQRIKKTLKAFLVILAIILIFNLSGKNILSILSICVFILFIFILNRTKKEISKSFGKLIRNKPYIFFLVKLVTKFMTHGVINTDRLSRKYRDVIIRILSSERGRRVSIIALVSFAITAYLLLPLGLVKNEFFPKTNADTIYVGLELPSGTSLEKLTNETEILADDLKSTRDTMHVVAEIGKAGVSGFSMNARSNTSLLTLVLIPKEKRSINSNEIAKLVRDKYSAYPKGKITVTEQSGGPPAGADIQIKLLGEDLSVLDLYADKIIDFLKNIPGVVSPDKSVKPGTSRLVFVPDAEKIAQNNLTVETLGFWMRTSVSGFTLDTVRLDNRDEDAVFYSQDATASPESLGLISIPTSNGYIPLLSLGSLKVKSNPQIITRDTGKRTISVSAQVTAGNSISDINKKLEKFASNDLRLPDGYEWKTGGVNDENQKSVSSILRAMGLSFLLIMATMVIEFKSYRQAAMILALIPFAISGVFVIFGLSGTPLSFPALIGVMALFGVVVTNAMFIVEKINQNRNGGMKLKEAIADAAQGRLEPITLTSLTSILGLIPITLANPLWRGLGGAIISGLLFSGMIMLLFIPVTYYLIYRSEE